MTPLMLVAQNVTRHNVNGVGILNICLIVAIVILVILAVAKLLGASIAPAAEWWKLLLGAAILFVIYLIV